MAPGNNGRHPSHTGTIPKTKVRNNCNVPQEAVTPTRRDMSTNLVSTSLDWVPVSEYNTRSNYSQSRKPTNNTTNNNSDHELTDIDNSGVFESGFGRFVPVRPQPRALPLNAQSRDNISEQQDDGASSSMTGHSLHPYGHQMQNGLIPQSKHAAAAVMIVNPTTPNAAGNIQTIHAPNQNRNNLSRNLNPARNTFEGTHSTNPPAARAQTKTVNLMNNMYEQGQGSFNNLNENNHARGEGSGSPGAAGGDAAAVERRLGQIREYIRVTSSLVDTMRTSEDEAFIEHTKEEYDDLVKMVMQLKESETNLEQILVERSPDNVEVPSEEIETASQPPSVEITEVDNQTNKNDTSITNNNLKKVTNIENEQINKQNEHNTQREPTGANEHNTQREPTGANEHNTQREPTGANEHNTQGEPTAANEVDPDITNMLNEPNVNIPADPKEDELKDDDQLNQMLTKNILSCVERVAQMELLKKAKDSLGTDEKQETRRAESPQSRGSACSDNNDLWHNEIKNKMDMSQMRLAALHQHHRRLINFQQEAKEQLEEMNREREAHELQLSDTHDNFNDMQNQPHSGGYNPPRTYAANQIGVATTLPQCVSVPRAHGSRGSLHRDNVASGEEASGGAGHSSEEEDGDLVERGRTLHSKLRQLQVKKQHMETLVSEFQKLQMASRMGSARNTYSSSNDDSADEQPPHKCNKAVGANIKNEDPFKLMEIKAIKTALQKTKDLMRSVENYEVDQLSGAQDDAFREMSSTHSNIHDNKSDVGSVGEWSNDGSMCRVRNSLPQRHKCTNEQHSHQHAQRMPQHSQHGQLLPQHAHQMQQHMSQHPQQLQQQSQQQLPQHSQQSQQQTHEANIASLQEMAKELRLETEKIMGERARMKELVSLKEVSRKKKVNEEMNPGTSGAPGPAERRQMQLRVILADKQRELEALLNKEKILSSSREQHGQKTNPDSQAASVANHSYNSEQEEPDSRSEQLLMESQHSREIDNFRASGDNVLGGRPIPALPAHVLAESNYGSDSDSASRNKSNQRSRVRRRQPQQRQSDDSSVSQNNASQNIRHEPRAEPDNVNSVPPTAHHPESPNNMPYPHPPPPPCWNTKSNQDMRTNQFTQNSHSQTMDRLLGTPLSYPPAMFNMMMSYGMVGGCGCGCGVWGAWCWQQLVLQQREVQQLRDQLNHLEERWLADTASHTLNNQVPPGNRANNYWDNFRSYSRQNLLSANSKANAGQLGAAPAHNPHPLVGRSHNPLHRAASASASSPSVTPKRNTNAEDPPDRRRNLVCERSLSFSSAPDVLNVNQRSDPDAPTSAGGARHDHDNLNRQEPANSFRNMNITNSIPEMIQTHSNLNGPRRKSSSKLPANNSRRNCSLDYSQTSNVNIASTFDAPNPNLASTSRDGQDKATSKLFDLLKENVYSEVTALIGVNESHPDFLIQLFRELQLISSDALRQKVLHSIRSILSQYQAQDNDERPEAVSTSSGESNTCNVSANAMQLDYKIIRYLLLKSEEFCTEEFLDTIASQILAGCSDGRYTAQAKRRLLDMISKYEGLRVCQVMGELIENLPLFISCHEDAANETESSMMEVAGSLKLLSASDSQLHREYDSQLHREYDTWPESREDSARSSQDGKADNGGGGEMLNGDLAEADQTCPSEPEGAGPDEAPPPAPDEQGTPTEAEAEWLGLDRVPTRLHMEQSPGKQKD